MSSKPPTKEMDMGWKQKVDWHRAELTPNGAKREARREAYDKKYGMCSHGTHPAGKCGGRGTSGD